jgi:hypothetical protein
MDLGTDAGELALPIGAVVRGTEHFRVKGLAVETKLSNGFNKLVERLQLRELFEPA